MEPNTSAGVPPPNPPSVEAAYKRKCIALKKRLNEIEAENEMMRIRNQRGLKYVQKMRLESCILLERLAKVTGMAEEAQAGVSPELRARAAAMMSNAAALNGAAANLGGAGAENGNGKRSAYLDDDTEGSSDEQPPTPQERPLRIKRSRKSNAALDGGDEATNNTESATAAAGSSLPALAPAPSQEEMTSSFRVRTGSNSSTTPVANNNGTGTTSASAAAPPPDSTSSAMDMDTKEPKEES